MGERYVKNQKNQSVNRSHSPDGKEHRRAQASGGLSAIAELLVFIGALHWSYVDYLDTIVPSNREF